MTRQIEIVLPKLHPAQKMAVEQAARFNIMDCGRRFGKTLLEIDRATETALEGYPVGWFSPTYKLLLEAWRDTRRVLYPIASRINAQERRIELVTGGLIEFWSLDDPDAGRGRKYKRVIIDEAAMVKKLQEAWENSIRPTLTDWKGDAWIGSTPKGRNYFWKMFQWGLDPERTSWVSWKFPTSANPYIDPTEIEAARLELPERVFQQEYLAEFLEGEGVVFRNIDACMNAPHNENPDNHPRHRIIIGVDWGKHNDFTTISVGCGDCMVELDIDRFNQIDYAFQRKRLMVMAKKWNASGILPERNSMGEPIIEQLLRDGLPILGGPDNNPGFLTSATTKPQLIENLALTFEREEFQFLKDDLWSSELEAYERTVSPSTGRSRYNAPEGLHDDTVIARALMRWGVGKYSSLPDKQPEKESKYTEPRGGESRWKGRFEG